MGLDGGLIGGESEHEEGGLRTLGEDKIIGEAPPRQRPQSAAAVIVSPQQQRPQPPRSSYTSKLLGAAAETRSASARQLADSYLQSAPAERVVL